MPSFAVSSSTVKRRNLNFRFAVVSVTGMMFLGSPNRNRPMLKSNLEKSPEFNPSSTTHSTMPIGQGSRLAQGKSKNWLPAKGCSITHCCPWFQKFQPCCSGWIVAVVKRLLLVDYTIGLGRGMRGENGESDLYSTLQIDPWKRSNLIHWKH